MKAERRFRVLQAELTEIFNLAKDGDCYDFGRKCVLEKLKTTGPVDSLARVRSMNCELEDLSDQLTDPGVF